MTEIEISTFATVMLIGRIFSVILVAWVIYKQLKIWSAVKATGVKEKAWAFRALLFMMAVIMLIKNIIPIIIDIVAITQLGEGVLTLGKLSNKLVMSYFTSNNLTDLMMSIVTWMLYMNARRYK